MQRSVQQRTAEPDRLSVRVGGQHKLVHQRLKPFYAKPRIPTHTSPTKAQRGNPNS